MLGGTGTSKECKMLVLDLLGGAENLEAPHAFLDNKEMVMRTASIPWLALIIAPLSCSVTSETTTDDPAPCGELSVIEAGPVQYSPDKEALISTITVTVLDSDGAALPDIHATLFTDSDNVTLDEEELVTDSEGKVEFVALSRHFEEASFSATASRSSPVDAEQAVELEDTALALFEVGFQIEQVGAPSYTSDHGAFSFKLTLTDEVGPVEGARMAHQPVADEIAVHPGEITTDVSGQAEIDVEATAGGEFELRFKLDGIEPLLSQEVSLLGLTLSGDIIEAMSFAEIQNPRVGVMGVQIFDSEPRILGELEGSIAVDISNENRDFTIELPFYPPSDWLHEVDDDVFLGYFALALYNDAEETGRWDEDDFIIAASGTSGALIFRRSDALGPTGPEGWMFLSGLEEDPTVIPWQPTASQQDLLITTAPVRELELTALLDDPPNDSTRVGIFVVDAPAFMQAVEEGENPWLLLFDSDFSVSLLDESMESGSVSAPVDDPLKVLDPDTLIDWSMTQPLGPQFDITQLLILPVLYDDLDGQGLTEGDHILGSLQAPYGAQWHVSYIIDHPRILSFFTSGELGMHAGWNWWGIPKEYDIELVIVNMPGFPTLELDDDVPDGLTEIAFAVYGADTGNDDSPKATGRFASGGNANLIEITECTDCDLIEEGDILRVTEVYSETKFVDWTEPLVFGLFE